MQLDTIKSLVSSGGVLALQEAMLKEDQVEISTLELVASGLYVREVIIPAGTAVVSRVWKDSYIDIMISGDITVVTPEGTVRMEGYNLMVGVPERKRAGYAHKDTLWLTIHKTDSKSHEGLLDEMSVPNIQDLPEIQLCQDL